MQNFTQSELAKSAGLSRVQVCRLFAVVGRDSDALSDVDALCVFGFDRFRSWGFTDTVAAELVAEFKAEIGYLAACRGHFSWQVFVETEGRQFWMPAHSLVHLKLLIETFGEHLPAILPLHDVVDAGRKQLDKLKAERAAA